MKAYTVFESGLELELERVLVFANSPNEARRVGHTHLFMSPAYFDTRARRYEEADHALRPDATEPYAVTDLKVLRGLGWVCEDDGPACEGCDLYACGLDEYHVCNDCFLCAACRKGGCNCVDLDGQIIEEACPTCGYALVTDGTRIWCATIVCAWSDDPDLCKKLEQARDAFVQAGA